MVVRHKKCLLSRVSARGLFVATSSQIRSERLIATPLQPGRSCEASAEAYDGIYLMLSDPSQSDIATEAELRTIKSRFAPVLADAAQAIVDEAMSAASRAERRIAPTEVKHILEGINRGVISFDGNRIRFANDPLRVCSLFALNREYFLQIRRSLR